MKKIVDGNTACADVAYFFSEEAFIYPITPSSPMASEVDKLANDKHKKNILNEEVTLVEMQSEAGAAGALHGALVSGALATTFTSSQGLLLMIPNMYKIAGEGLPCVMHVSARTVATHALSIFGDHSDIYATRQTGFAMLASSNVFDAQNLAAVAHLSTIEARVPFMHFFDGFRTSHEINTIEGIDELELLKLVNFDKVNEFKKNALNTNCDYQRGMAENEDIYFQSLEARSGDYLNTADIVNDYMSKINKIMNTEYKPFNYYGAKDAKYVIVAMGSVCDTIKLVVDKLNSEGKKYGLIEVHLYRPFSTKYLVNVLPDSVSNIAVLDKTKEMGSVGEPLYLDVIAALKDKDINIVGGRYGISSKDTDLNDILSVYNMLESNPKNNFTIGIKDDLNNTSLEKVDYNFINSTKEMLIYGFGSDGMVSASKDILKIIGNNTDKYVQGYFKYDSKKSGGITISNIRISDNNINMPFYVDNPSVVVVTKEDYLYRLDVLNNIEENGILLINTNKNIDELVFSKGSKDILLNKNIKVLLIDANKIAMECNITGKISKIMEVIILNLLDYKDSVKSMSESIINSFSNKGKDIVDANIKALNMALNNVVEVNNIDNINEIGLDNSIINMINNMKGDNLKVSDISSFKNGIFPCGLSRDEKRIKSNLVPKWNKDNCIECGMCSIVCPHAVIRPFITKDRGIDLIGNSEYKYEILVSEDDCTNCGLCVSACPGKMGNKALSMDKRTNSDSEYVNEMFKNYINPNVMDKYNVKGSQLQKPLFEFSGACSGCGETPYIKLLTQLFGHELVIANATGCSSIYGGSVPSTPYLIPWANSLFEDNAEFGYGMKVNYNKMRQRVEDIIKLSYDSVDDKVKALYDKWLNNKDNYEITNEVRNELINLDIPSNLKDIIDYMIAKSVWMIGGDGWAYDIGFGGIDHVLSSGEDVNILVLDTEVYSNTGGQASKSSHIGQVAEFANMGKKTYKKDLFRIAMSYPNCYVGNVSLGYNFMQTIKVMKEAKEHKGPSIIICYCPCIEQGIKGGMCNSSNEQKLAVECGYTTLMHYNPEEEKLYIDSREPDFNKYKDFLMNEVRYRTMVNKDASLAKELLLLNLNESKRKYEYYKKISEN